MLKPPCKITRRFELFLIYIIHISKIKDYERLSLISA